MPEGDSGAAAPCALALAPTVPHPKKLTVIKCPLVNNPNLNS